LLQAGKRRFDEKIYPAYSTVSRKSEASLTLRAYARQRESGHGLDRSQPTLCDI
jgi:hypothetical protein